MKQNNGRAHIGFSLFLSALTLTLLGVSSVLAFTSIQKQQVTARVVMGGTPPGPSDDISIAHTPLRGISAVTQMMIVQGEAGTNPSLISNVEYPGRITPLGVSPKAGDSLIQVYVRFRMIGPPSAGGGEIVALPPITGPDPVPFAFQVSPSSVSVGNIQYQIIANRLEVQGSTLVVTATATYPVEAETDLDSHWVTVGVRNQESALVGPEGGQIVIVDGNPNDGQTVLTVPAGLFNEPAQVTINEVPLNSPFIPSPAGFSQFEAVYEINSDRPFNGKMKLNVLYPDFIFPQGQDGEMDVSKQSENSAALVWWDGFTWRRIGGRANAFTNTLEAIVTQSSLFAVVSAAPVTAKERRPLEKIITPNGDGRNDSAIFDFSGLAAGANIAVEIFDVTGHRVRTINSVNSFTWDGRDDSGGIVESGVYIYQFKVDGERVSGLIAVAK